MLRHNFPWKREMEAHRHTHLSTFEGQRTAKSFSFQGDGEGKWVWEIQVEMRQVRQSLRDPQDGSLTWTLLICGLELGHRLLPGSKERSHVTQGT